MEDGSDDNDEDIIAKLTKTIIVMKKERTGAKVGDVGTKFQEIHKAGFKEVANSKLTAFIKKHLNIYHLNGDMVSLKQ